MVYFAHLTLHSYLPAPHDYTGCARGDLLCGVHFAGHIQYAQIYHVMLFCISDSTGWLPVAS